MKKIVIFFLLATSLFAGNINKWFNAEFAAYKNILIEIDYDWYYKVQTAEIIIKNKNDKKVDVELVLFDNSAGEKLLYDKCLPELKSEFGEMYLSFDREYCFSRFSENGYKDFLKEYMKRLSRTISNTYMGTYQKPVLEILRIKD